MHLHCSLRTFTLLLSIVVRSPPVGFYCPGKANDRVNNLPGSKPIIVPVGDTSTPRSQVQSVVTEMKRVATTLSLDGEDLTAVNETQIRLNLARIYKVPLELISLEFSAGSIVIRVYIAEGRDPEHSIASLLATVSSQADALSQELGLEGMNVSSSPPIVAPHNVTMNETVTTFVVTDCPEGSW